MFADTDHNWTMSGDIWTVTSPMAVVTRLYDQKQKTEYASSLVQ